MVNKTEDRRKIIISMLRNSKGPLSGQILSDSLGVSRVAVWKQINNMKDLGYNIRSTPSGYVLDSDEDHLYSWEFEGKTEHYKAFRELDSTMEMARKEAVDGCPSFTTIVAEKQNKGRGRGDRSWLSPEGGLYFTWIIRPELPLAYHYIYTLAAASALVLTTEELFGIELKTKWPNDLLWKGKKTAGILAEMQSSGDSLQWLNLGVGINVNNHLSDDRSVSLSEITGRELDRRSLLTKMELRLKNILSSDSPEEIRALWEKKSDNLGRQIELETAGGRRFAGEVLSLDAAGSLVIKNNRNSTEQALFGDLYIKKEK